MNKEDEENEMEKQMMQVVCMSQETKKWRVMETGEEETDMENNENNECEKEVK